MYERDARMAKLDEFGVDGAIVYRRVHRDHRLLRQDETGNEVLNAYNRYMHDNWGFHIRDRLYTTALLSLWDLEKYRRGKMADQEWCDRDHADGPGRQ